MRVPPLWDGERQYTEGGQRACLKTTLAPKRTSKRRSKTPSGAEGDGGGAGGEGSDGDGGGNGGSGDGGTVGGGGEGGSAGGAGGGGSEGGGNG